MNKIEYKKFIISDYISHCKIYGLRLVTNILINLITLLSTLKLIVGNIIYLYLPPNDLTIVEVAIKTKGPGLFLYTSSSICQIVVPHSESLISFSLV